MENGSLLKLIESQGAQLASLRRLVEEGFQTLNWKMDRLVEIGDNLNSRESINNRRLSKLEIDVGVLKGDMAAVKADMSSVMSDVAGVKADVAGVKADVAGVKADVAGLMSDVAAIKAKLSA